jgi:hypothetical protein
MKNMTQSYNPSTQKAEAKIEKCEVSLHLVRPGLKKKKKDVK